MRVFQIRWNKDKLLASVLRVAPKLVKTNIQFFENKVRSAPSGTGDWKHRSLYSRLCQAGDRSQGLRKAKQLQNLFSKSTDSWFSTCLLSTFEPLTIFQFQQSWLTVFDFCFFVCVCILFLWWVKLLELPALPLSVAALPIFVSPNFKVFALESYY